MKILILLSLIISHLTYARASDHECQVSANKQTYSKVPFQFISSENYESSWFDVSKDEHKDVYVIDIKNDKSILGKAKVWTGTLMGRSEGDFVQGHATISIADDILNFSLIMDIRSSFAKTLGTIEIETENNLHLIPSALVCRIKK